MKRYFPLVAVLALIPTPFVAHALLVSEPQVVTSELLESKEGKTTKTTVAASQLDPELEAYAKSISVKISSNNSDKGSGVLIGKQGNKYLVITNNHVLRGGENFTIQTEDGTNHQATVIDSPITSDDDIALLTFESSDRYKPIKLNSANAGNTQKDIYAVGYAADTGEFSVEPGKIEHITEQTFQQGYRIGYSSNVRAGMSGGAIFDETGDLIGINGISAYPILDTIYQYEDGTKPNPEELNKFRSLSWGLSLHRLLTQLNPEIIAAYNLPLPETVAEIGNIELTGWLVNLEAKAKQFTVKIDDGSSSEKNGSGVIIAKEGNTYTVLTADHVLCEKAQNAELASDDCLPRSYTITTPDGKQYPLDRDTIKAQEGVDLAVFTFDSDEIYQVAELANYPLATEDPVFVAGFPKLVSNQPAEWAFSLGYGLEKEQGLLNVNVSGSSSSENLILQEEPEGASVEDVDTVSLAKGSNSVVSQGSLYGGYEMVYTSATYGGMSGGAVLDRKGRVIGIHGAAEGETALDTQSGSKKQIQMGYSLGIPINTFIGLTDRFDLSNTLSVQNNRPEELNSQQKEEFETAILGAKISQGNTTPEGWLERGNILWRLKQYDKSVEAFDRAIELNPEFIHLAYYGKGIALYRDKKYEASIASFEKANQADPNYEPAFSWKSAAFNKLNQYEEALAAIDRAIFLVKDNPVHYSQKGIYLKSLKRYQEAEQAHSNAIKISPREAFYTNRALVYEDLDKADLALKDYNKAIEINPNSLFSYRLRGLFYKRQGEKELAIADFNKALKINPSDPLTLYNIADAYRFGSLYPKNPQKALEVFQKASELGDNDAAFEAANMLTEGEGVEQNYELAGKLLLDAANRDSFKAKAKLAKLIINRHIPDNSNLDVEQMAISADENGYPEGLGSLTVSLREGKNGYQVDLKKAALLANQALKRFSERSLDQEGAWPMHEAGFAYSIQKAIEGGVMDEKEVIVSLPELKRHYFYTKEGLKRFTVPIDCGTSGKHPFHVYIWDAEESIVPLNNQFKWIEEARGCTVAKDVKDSFDKLFDIAKENNVSFTELTVYTFDNADKNKEQAETNNTEVASNNQEQSNSDEDATTYVRKGFAYFEEEKLDLAIEQYNKAIELAPNEPTAYEVRSAAYLQQEKYDLALADIEKAIELGSTNSIIYRLRGIFNTDKNTDLALEDFTKAIELDPKNAKAYFYRANLYRKQRKFDLALADLNRGIEIDPKQADTEVYFSRGNIYLRQQKYDLALADYNQSLALDNSNILSSNNIGLVKYEMGDIEGALQQFIKVTKANDQLAEPKLSIATIMFTLGKTEAAIRTAKNALTLDIKFAESEHQKDNLWGEQLIADTERLLAHPEIQEVLAKNKSTK